MPKKEIFAGLNREIFDSKNDSSYTDNTLRGLSLELIHKISSDKNEPKWMLDLRIKALETFYTMEAPNWGPDVSHEKLNIDEICFYARASEIKNAKNWDEVPDDIKETFEKLGIPEAERAMLAGAGAQYESESVYHKLKEKWDKLGVIFLDMDEAIHEYPEIVKKHFMKCVPIHDHKFAALHAAVWSGGTFLYIPKGIKVNEPLQSYFRMNAPGMGQFEHTMIILEDETEAHYIEGCSAPKYGERALHAGCVEIYIGNNSHMRYSSVENWSKDTYNLNTKRAILEKNARIEWVGGNLGSGLTMLYPCSILKGEGSSADHLGVTFANTDQNQDTGAKIYHLASNTSSRVLSKSLSKDGGIATYRGIIKVSPNAKNCTIHSECDGLLLDDKSTSYTFPELDIANSSTTVAHEASIGKINEDDIFYLMSRGLSREQSESTIVNGFLAPIIRELPMEYAIEMNRLIEIEMEQH